MNMVLRNDGPYPVTRRLWFEAPDGLRVLVTEFMQAPGDSMHFDRAITVPEHHKLVWEDEEHIPAPPPGPECPRDFILQALGEFFAACDENDNVMPTNDAVRITEQLLVDLGLSEFDPSPDEWFEEAPAWFIEWKHSQYNADVTELADGLQRLRTQHVSLDQGVRVEIDRMGRRLTDFKLTKRAKRHLSVEPLELSDDR